MFTRLRVKIVLCVVLIGLTVVVGRLATRSTAIPVALVKTPPAATFVQIKAPKATPLERSGFFPIALTSDGQSFAPLIDLKEPDARSRFHNPAKPVCPIFPKHFADPVRVRCGVADVCSQPIGARPESVGTIADNGDLVYANAFEGCDVSYRCEAYKTEEFITVKDANAQTTWSWDLDTHGLTPRLTPADTIELCDAAGVPRLRINAPEGKDRDGKVLRVGNGLSLSLDGAHVTLVADLKGCAFPVAIDPSWSSTGIMTQPRVGHSMTPLPDGTVLIVGGLNPTGQPPTATCDIFDPVTGVCSSTGNMATARWHHAAVLLSNGGVLIIGGNSDGASNTSLSLCEVYDVPSRTWKSASSMSVARYSHSAILLQDETVLVMGGTTDGQNVLTSCELFPPSGGSWVSTGGMNIARAPSCLRFGDGRVLAIGDLYSSTITCELYDPLSKAWAMTGSLSAQHPTGFGFSLLGPTRALVGGGISSGSATSACEVYDEGTGTWAATGNLPASLFLLSFAQLGNGPVLAISGEDSRSQSNPSCELYDGMIWSNASPVSVARNDFAMTVLRNDSVLISGGNTNFGVTSSCEILNFAPSVTASTSLTGIVSGQSASFSSIVVNPDGDALTYLWNFGDGTTSTDANPTHVFAIAGVYQVTCTVTDNGNVNTASISNVLTITAYKDSDRPTARFVSSDLNGFVGLPVGFDATFSTDPLNNIVSYDWDFGDGSPHGSGQAISRAYTAEGTYTVRLTVTDGRGLIDTTTLTMVILPAAQAGLLNPNIKYSVNWNRSATNADSLNLSATVNVGSTAVTSASPLALNIVGQTFTGTSTTKLALPRAGKLGPEVTWKVKSVTKKGTPGGTYALTCSIKHASLGVAFALAGATGTKTGTARIPVRLGVGGSSFASGIQSSFKFSSNGKASGGGEASK